jgi:selenide,water dikinase
MIKVVGEHHDLKPHLVERGLGKAGILVVTLQDDMRSGVRAPCAINQDPSTTRDELRLVRNASSCSRRGHLTSRQGAGATACIGSIMRHNPNGMNASAFREKLVERPLTAFAKGAGCGCKLPAADLLPIVRGLPRQEDERLLVDATTSDDAAVYRLGAGMALVQTIDFFTPHVDDAYDFGRIAAANALSDVYAMGGTPLTALNVVAFPLARLGGEVLGKILRGGMDVVARAGALVVGGHSIEDAEPKYGLAVTGVVDPARIVTNAGGQAGDLLVLSKPLGVGAVVTARKRGFRDPRLLAQAVETMVTLNDEASRTALEADARAMTDVTGFGLLGHLHHLCRESGLAAEIDAAAVPALDGVEGLLVGEHGVSGGSRGNADWARSFTTFAEEVVPWRRRLLSDATTSGGLLAAVPAHAERLPGVAIGHLVEGAAGTIAVS